MIRISTSYLSLVLLVSLYSASEAEGPRTYTTGSTKDQNGRETVLLCDCLCYSVAGERAGEFYCPITFDTEGMIRHYNQLIESSLAVGRRAVVSSACLKPESCGKGYFDQAIGHDVDFLARKGLAAGRIVNLTGNKRASAALKLGSKASITIGVDYQNYNTSVVTFPAVER